MSTDSAILVLLLTTTASFLVYGFSRLCVDTDRIFAAIDAAILVLLLATSAAGLVIDL